MQRLFFLLFWFIVSLEDVVDGRMKAQITSMKSYFQNSAVYLPEFQPFPQ